MPHAPQCDCSACYFDALAAVFGALEGKRRYRDRLRKQGKKFGIAWYELEFHEMPPEA
jgi:hypothetical protein